MTAEAIAGFDAPSDEQLALSLPGDFRSGHTEVNGTTLHHVSGGHGEPLVLLPGWPQTWWAYHKMMPLLAERFRVIAVDLRGMGGSGKPDGGYDKRTMARDVLELVHSFGYDSVNLAGHDMGAMVAFSFAVNHPAATRRLALLDVLHPDDSRYEMRMMQRPGTGFNMWWWAFNQVVGLPEQIMAGRGWYLVDWLFSNSLFDQEAISELDRLVFARAYDTPEGIRATNAWYQAFHQDIADMRTYGKVEVPVLGLASPVNYDRFAAQLPDLADDVRTVRVDGSSHWLASEQPELLSRLLADFFG